ncbi:MFS transporter [Herbidospora sp. NEAU-GS84]|uniref:MFS transporter n=1 Tax=Herbidospora solisilvae TaxID=2696284 RepID=A0A7C9NBD9_9ACTN|nr:MULTISPECIES: MFS transporter [Herbidospora]NAS20295.1 MFS transporter [Herbidospora solisilvae]
MTRSWRPVAGLFAASLIAHTGTRVSAIAIPWFVLVTTGSVTQTGLVAFCEMAPYVLVKALAGPVVDRMGPRRMSWRADAVSAVAATLIPILHFSGGLSFPVLLVLVAVIGAVRGPGDLAKEIMVPEAAELGRIPLERAAGLAGVAERLASTVGPAVAGALVALTGPMVALIANAVCFALGSVIVATVLPKDMGHRPAETGPKTGYWRRFGEGFAFLRNERLMLTITIMVGLTNFLDAAFSSLLLPVWAKETGGGPAAIGLATSVMGVSAVAGSLIAAMVAHRLPRRLVFFLGFLVIGAPRFLILAVDVPLWAVIAVFAVGGFGSGFLNPIIGAIYFERVPRPMLGRVNSLSDAVAWSGMPLGGLAAGAAVAAAGLVPVLAFCGVAYFLITTLTGLRPEWREMRSAPVTGPVEVEPGLPVTPGGGDLRTGQEQRTP